MKKIIASIIVCGFAFAFVACGGGKKAADEEAKAVADSTAKADSVAAATKKKTK